MLDSTVLAPLGGHGTLLGSKSWSRGRPIWSPTPTRPRRGPSTERLYVRSMSNWATEP